MKYIDRAWKSYRNLLIQQGAGEVQIKETRQAFFSGAAILFQVIMKGLDSAEETTDADMRMMADVEREIDDFGRELDTRFFGAMPPFQKLEQGTATVLCDRNRARYLNLRADPRALSECAPTHR